MLKILVISSVLFASVISYAETTKGIVPALKPQEMNKTPSSDVLRIDSSDYYVLKANQSSDMLITIEARCMFENCQFNLDLFNSQDFIVVSSEQGDSSIGKTAVITVMWNPVSLVNDINTFSLEAILYTTNLKENFSLKKNIPVFVYK